MVATKQTRRAAFVGRASWRQLTAAHGSGFSVRPSEPRLLLQEWGPRLRASPRSEASVTPFGGHVPRTRCAWALVILPCPPGRSDEPSAVAPSSVALRHALLVADPVVLHLALQHHLALLPLDLVQIVDRQADGAGNEQEQRGQCGRE